MIERFVILGAGAIGTVIAAHLAAAGRRVAIVARGARLATLRADGLRLETPAGVIGGPAEIVETVAQLAWSTDDIALVAVKTQDAAAILDALACVAPATLPIACLTNGLETERLAVARFANVYGVCVMCPATHLAADAIQAWGAPVAGLFDLGRIPSGRDAIADALAAAFEAARLSARALPDILRWKRTKLLLNLTNAIDALCGSRPADHPLVLATRAEGDACFRAAGLDLASPVEDAARRAGFGSAPIPGRSRRGSSTYQSLARGTGVECQYLNGEIVTLGLQHAVPTPINAGLLREISLAAATQRMPGTLTLDELATRLGV